MMTYYARAAKMAATNIGFFTAIAMVSFLFPDDIFSREISNDALEIAEMQGSFRYCEPNAASV